MQGTTGGRDGSEEGSSADGSESPDAVAPVDRFVPSVGFVIAGFGVAAGFVPWTDAVAAGPVESVPSLLAAVVALVAFGGRRHGIDDRRLSVLAGIGAGSLAWVAVVALLYPVAVGTEGVRIGSGVPVGFVLGVLGFGVAYADYLGFDRAAFLHRSQYASAGLAIGLFGLFVGFVFSAVGVTVLPVTDDLLRNGVGTAAFSIGLGVVAVGYLVVTDRTLSFFDVEWPRGWDWGWAAGGVIAMFVILFALAALADFLGIGAAQHGLIEAARDNPALLLPFIPLSWLAIGPGEELLSRNVVQKHLYDAFSRRSAVLVATGVFTLIHIPAYATAEPAAVFATLVRLFAISLVLGVVYERTRNVVVAALVHGTYNAIQFALAYVSLTTGVI